MSDGVRLARRQDVLRRRAAIIQGIRRFFIERDYLEVETPHRIPVPIPETYIDAVPSESCFLHTSPEICMKRMLAAGYPRIFQICRCFRKGERGNRHLPEFTMLEWYRVKSDYFELMSECEDLLIDLTGELWRHERLVWQGRTVDLRKPWDRLTVKEAFGRYASSDTADALKKGLFDEVMAFEIEPRLGLDKPVFLYDYPVSLGALARRKAGHPDLAERFELYIGGVELVNAFSELTEVAEQRERFQKDEAVRRSLGKSPYSMPEKFLQALPQMPESAGAALGVDRVVMLLTGATQIDDVVAFTPEEL
jgi:lysyl-tRNA synthetase class 2